jgi:hypothetical protein
MKHIRKLDEGSKGKLFDSGHLSEDRLKETEQSLQTSSCVHYPRNKKEGTSH